MDNCRFLRPPRPPVLRHNGHHPLRIRHRLVGFERGRNFLFHVGEIQTAKEFGALSSAREQAVVAA